MVSFKEKCFGVAQYLGRSADPDSCFFRQEMLGVILELPIADA
jgi:hypothetical protein